MIAGYPYRTAIDWGIFLIAGLLAIVIAIFTVSFRGGKAASKSGEEFENRMNIL